jgi:hypothetical protein
MEHSEISGYQWDGAELTCAHAYLLPTVTRELARLRNAAVDDAGGQVVRPWLRQRQRGQ